MRPKRMLIAEFGLILASSVNYAAVTLMYIVWGLEMALILLILFAVCFMLGLIALDLRKTLVYTCVALILGNALVTLVMVAPPIVLGEGASIIDSAVNTALIAVSKFLIFAVVIAIVSALMGSVLADWFEPIDDFQI